jgi:hypothetical protein
VGRVLERKISERVLETSGLSATTEEPVRFQWHVCWDLLLRSSHLFLLIFWLLLPLLLHRGDTQVCTGAHECQGSHSSSCEKPFTGMYVLHAHYTPFRKIEESKGKSFVFLTPFCLVWCLCVCVCVCVSLSLSLSLALSLSY